MTSEVIALRRARRRRRVVRSLCFGLLLFLGTSIVAPTLITNRQPGSLNIVSAADGNPPDGMATCIWSRSFGADRLTSFRTRSVFYTGMSMIVEPERIETWPWPSDLGAWTQPVEPPWHELRETTLAVGWPMRAAKATMSLYLNNTTPTSMTSVDGGTTYLDPGMGPLLLPLRPVWPGFAVNLALCVVTVHALQLAFAAARDRRRRKRGRCVLCDHPRANEVDACTECGCPAPCA